VFSCQYSKLRVDIRIHITVSHITSYVIYIGVFCTESGLAGIFTAHLVLQVPRPSTACVNAFTSGYKDWFLNDYCQGAVDDIVIYTKLRGSPVDISTTVATNVSFLLSLCSVEFLVYIALDQIFALD